jgi:hypothetical protein
MAFLQGLGDLCLELICCITVPVGHKDLVTRGQARASPVGEFQPRMVAQRSDLGQHKVPGRRASFGLKVQALRSEIRPTHRERTPNIL